MHSDICRVHSGLSVWKPHKWFVTWMHLPYHHVLGCLFSYTYILQPSHIVARTNLLSLSCRRYLTFIFVGENLRILIKFLTQFVPKGRMGISQHWLGAERMLSHRLDQWLSSECMCTSPSLSELIDWHSRRLSHKPLNFVRFTMYLVTT